MLKECCLYHALNRVLAMLIIDTWHCKNFKYFFQNSYDGQNRQVFSEIMINGKSFQFLPKTEVTGAL